jgi:hypothetical protein
MTIKPFLLVANVINFSIYIFSLYIV